jgi:hypothetical protein
MRADVTEHNGASNSKLAREYETPKLVSYGQLRAVTTRGTAHAVESSPGVSAIRP